LSLAINPTAGSSWNSFMFSIYVKLQAKKKYIKTSKDHGKKSRKNQGETCQKVIATK
jgi:hypothetical protein